MLSKEEIEKFKVKTIKIIKKNTELISDSLTSLTEQKHLLQANDIMNNALYFIEQLEQDWEKLCNECSEATEKANWTKEDTKRLIVETREINRKAEKYDLLIEKLKKDIQKANRIINDKDYRYIEEVIDEQYERRKYAQEILEIAKGENDEL